jgi:hypothetical protein
MESSEITARKKLLDMKLELLSKTTTTPDIGLNKYIRETLADYKKQLVDMQGSQSNYLNPYMYH